MWHGHHVPRKASVDQQEVNLLASCEIVRMRKCALPSGSVKDSIQQIQQGKRRNGKMASCEKRKLFLPLYRGSLISLPHISRQIL